MSAPAPRRLLGAVPPASARELGAPVASPGQRIGAFLLDVAVIVAAATVTGILTGHILLALIVAAEIVIGIWAWEARQGLSFGKLILGLRTLRAEQRLPLGTWRATTKFAVLGLGGLLAAVGALVVEASTSFDRTPARQGWHDKASGSITVVVRGRTPQPAPTTTGLVTRTVAARGPAAQPPPVAPLPIAPSPTTPPMAAPPPAAQAAIHPPHAVAPGAPGAGYPHPRVAAPPPQAAPSPSAPPAAPPHAASPQDWPPPGIPGPGAPAAQPGTPRPVTSVPGDQVSVVLDDGRRYGLPLPGRSVIGRRPSALNEDDALVQMPDEGRNVSRNHLLVEVSFTGIRITDLGSANGTRVVVDGVPHRLTAHTPVQLPQSCRILLGDFALTLIRTRRQESPGVR